MAENNETNTISKNQVSYSPQKNYSTNYILIFGFIVTLLVIFINV